MTTPLTAEPFALAEVLTAAADRYPDVCAVRTDAEYVSYRELHERVVALAAGLRAAGVGAGHAVGVYLPRSVQAVIAIHAVVAVGAVVAPLDVGDPPDRTRSLLDQAGIAHVLVASTDRGRAPVAESTTEGVGERLCLIHVLLQPNSDRGERAGGAAAPFADPGYLLFTSGSTGLPKGVLLGHRAVVHFARWAASTVAMGPGDRVAAQAALTFDLSTFDIFATAIAGATAVILPDWLKPFPADIVDWLAENEISVIYAVPTLLSGIVAAVGTRTDVLPALRVIAFAGEPYPAGALRELASCFTDAAIRNWYGPTETNVCTAADIRAWNHANRVSVGTAIDGVTVCTVDDELRACAEGELVVAGPTLLTGYVIDGTLVDPAVTVTFPDGVARRAYRTGDYAYRDDRGDFVLTGRADHQIKRRGYRIDLAGIESIAGDVPGVAAAAVATGEENRITLFVDPGAPADHPVATAAMRAVTDAIHQRLPVTSRPDAVTVVSPLPITQRGKVDRIGLQGLATGKRASPRPPVPTHTPVQQER